MKIRKTTANELPLLLELVEQSRLKMRADGNMNQWNNGNPKPELFINDIEHGNSYMCIDDNGTLVGTFAFIPGPDPTYLKIYNGDWIENEKPYGVIHRLASATNSHGVAAACLDWCYGQIANLRIDTHRDNHIMQHIMQRHGFTYCGIIFLESGDERLAYQKTQLN